MMECINELDRIVFENGGSMKRTEACQMLGMTTRLVRDLANEAGRHILPTNDGYLHVYHASAEQQESAYRRMHHMALAVLARCRQMRFGIEEARREQGVLPLQTDLNLFGVSIVEARQDYTNEHGAEADEGVTFDD